MGKYRWWWLLSSGRLEREGEELMGEWGGVINGMGWRWLLGGKGGGDSGMWGLYRVTSVFSRIIL